jgi:hypothetical protein
MESEKSKETLWTIHIRESKDQVKLRYREREGKIESIFLGIGKPNNNINLEMSPDEFHKIYLILKSFRDLIGSDKSFNSDQPIFEEDSSDITVKKKEFLNDNNMGLDEWDPW